MEEHDRTFLQERSCTVEAVRTSGVECVGETSRLLESAGNAINAASTPSALPRKKGAPGPPIAKALPAASGPITRPSPATPCARPSVSPCVVGGLANESSADTTGVTAPSLILTTPRATNNRARFVLHESNASPAASI